MLEPVSELNLSLYVLRPEHMNGKKWNVLLITLTLHQSFAFKSRYCFINNPLDGQLASYLFRKVSESPQPVQEFTRTPRRFSLICWNIHHSPICQCLPSKRSSPSSLDWVSIYVHTSPPWQHRNDQVMPEISQTRISSIISHMRDCKFRPNPTAMTYKNNFEPFHGLVRRQDRENSNTVAVQEGTWWQQEIKAREHISFPAFAHVIFFGFLRAFIAAEKPKDVTDVDVLCQKNMGAGPNTKVWLTLKCNAAFCWL